MEEKREYRIEHDSIGTKEVPADAYYGVQTLRAYENFYITGLKMQPELINSVAQIKKAAAITNYEVGELDKKRTDAIVKACDEIIAGKLHDQFIVDPIQGGAGTSLNMNANEVIANRAIEILGGKKGDYSIVNPNDHVNFGQSTNDVFPSCGKMAALKLLDNAHEQLIRLDQALTKKAYEFDHVIKMGRTQLQDAVPIRLGQEFHAYSTAIKRDIKRFEAAKEEIKCLNLGGTAIGTGLNADVQYFQRVVKNTSTLSGQDLVQSYDLIDATQNLDSYASVSGIVKTCAVNLSKISNDLRLMSSGPRTGFGEINLPAKQNGSSIMPGKINPVIPEVMNQVAFNIIGNDMTITMAAEAGQLELNAFEPIIFYNLFQSIETLTCAIKTLVDNCITGITANEEHCKNMVNNSIGIVTAICPYVGYEKAADIAKEALKTNKSVRELILEKNLLDEKQLNTVLNPYTMTEPGILGKEMVR
ncbi:aspartate ammonia-lyase [[Clostridium] symbiosum]|uniref:aspartate ammonia-lyase n=1 Tax=Clostridium symbiosum TaxID=1512 RepID=UPI001D06498C|nr:aspartate ammonia-lyase [[Clostridium] symbiosum]MCB6609767.1 aspartate ammonia-lyase [[Clostridium] symbiosum]MCB6931278.1 aspartate ammonia-lyase [[Clostridium] symbiosum]